MTNSRTDPITVLAVDDEPDVLRVLKFALERHGLAVRTAANGTAAVELFGQTPGGIDVVVTDVRMPGMDGAQLLDALRAIDPGVRVVVLSGGADYPAADLLRRGARAVLDKPCGLADLARVVRRVAEGTPVAPVALDAPG